MSDTTYSTLKWTDDDMFDFFTYLKTSAKVDLATTHPQILEAFKKGKEQPPLNRSDVWIKEQSWNDQQECLSKKEMGGKPWQILTFGDKHSTVKWNLNVQGGYGSMNWSLQEMLSDRNRSVASGQLFIESVRRNSDGEVFKTGDEFIYLNNNDTITGLKYLGSGFGLIVVKGNKRDYWLSDINKTPAKLFTTTDGVDIFPGMPYWSVDPDFTIFFSGGAGDGSGTEPGRKYFSTPAAAESFAYENRPIYSVKDFREIIKAFEERIAIKTPE